MHVAQSTSTATSYHDLLSRLNQISDEIIGISIVDNCATRHLQNNIFSLRAVHFLSRTCLPGRSLKMLAVTIIDKRVEITRRFYIDTTTSSTITPVWTAERYISFTAKVYRAITTFTSLHKNLCMIV